MSGNFHWGNPWHETWFEQKNWAATIIVHYVHGKEGYKNYNMQLYNVSCHNNIIMYLYSYKNNTDYLHQQFPWKPSAFLKIPFFKRILKVEIKNLSQLLFGRQVVVVIISLLATTENGLARTRAKGVVIKMFWCWKVEYHAYNIMHDWFNLCTWL